MAANVITIDGPTSSGKNSVGLYFSKKIGYRYLDTGSIYRAFSLHLLKNKIDLHNDQAIIESLHQAKIDYKDEGTDHEVFLNDEDVTSKLHTPEVTAIVADIAQIPGVREIARLFQRELGTKQNTVMAGRDIGNGIFPESKLKFYLTADPEIRARRRYNQLILQDPNITFEQILKQLNERDQKDMNRSLAPLKVPKDAVVIDTTNLTVEESVGKMLTYYHSLTKS